MADLKVFIATHWYSNKTFVAGAFKTKKEFWDAYEKELGIDLKSMEREDKEDYNSAKSDSFDKNTDPVTDESVLLAIENPGKILFIPNKLFDESRWKEKIENHSFFGGKFVDKNTLKKLEDMKTVMEQSDNYVLLKNKIIKLAENLKKNEPNYLV